MEYMMPVDAKWQVWTDKDLVRWNAGTPDEKAWAEWLEQTYKLFYLPNKISFFLAHSGAVDFLNDITTEVKVLQSGNQCGKSFAGLADMILDAVPCSEEWPCFTEHGLKYREWTGPKKIMMSSYQWMHAKRNLWPKFQELMPAGELREYSKEWQAKKRYKVRSPNWQTNPSVPCACGSQVDFFAYQQPPEAFESSTYNRVHFDETPPENCYDGAYARGTTCSDFRVIFTLTPHVVEGRPDTGAGSFLAPALQGSNIKNLRHGDNFKIYKMKVDEVPDAIIAPKKKEELFEKYVAEPRRTGNLRKQREGRSRYYGEVQVGEGLVYDAWNPATHWIDPFDVPAHWPRYRAIDPGRVHPTAGLWAAMSPWGDMVLYREYYESGPIFSECAKQIIAASGNDRIQIDLVPDADGGMRAMWEEVPRTEEYEFSVMDGRTFKQPHHDAAETIGQYWATLGIPCIAASGMKNELAVPLVREWFEPKAEREHILKCMKIQDEVLGEDGKPLTMAPRIYVFNTLRHFRTEIEGYVNKPDSEKPVDKNDHLMTALKYLVLANPQWIDKNFHLDPYEQPKSAGNSRFLYV